MPLLKIIFLLNSREVGAKCKSHFLRSLYHSAFSFFFMAGNEKSNKPYLELSQHGESERDNLRLLSRSLRIKQEQFTVGIDEFKAFVYKTSTAWERKIQYPFSETFRPQHC